MSRGITLVMDSSASPLLLALEKDGKIYTARRKGIKQEKLLFPLLRKLLVKAQAELQDISRICIIRGPGRFTGIRIALTFASMLQMLRNTQVYGATLFEVLHSQVTASRDYRAWKKNHPNGALAVVLHAFREEYFLQIFDKSNKGPQWLSREELLSQLAAYTEPLFVAGTDKEFAPLEGLLGTTYPLAAYKDCRVRAQTLIGFTQDDKWTRQALEPLYLKPARFELITPK
ncbi:MAG: tRNA (adenosine(37)-N6)-threonylcarbamoyltransferase complex dimerization subunit type 1 TsaB [Elusimicrobiaceae bacterium]|nr:tRNA (adenosine(37)-N6)-threonylcarbamoyltransferase complex dimerization subunit type 1 TsaB [Elusimicrobiaceae bacterium]